MMVSNEHTVDYDDQSNAYLLPPIHFLVGLKHATTISNRDNCLLAKQSLPYSVFACENLLPSVGLSSFGK